ncbi:MAG: type II toxin-antitoxin system RelE/ParE family toxin [Chloroflexota bacterium]|nr:type II toxin-antitoxin system RelE/ParE family toxin [Chloroflexota bacterium]MDE2909712.1 type II toxin-antitoxin system RelE/ParE family toxin [Chloroflexota bacterium]
MPLQFRYSEDFARDFARLRKRYRRIEDDLAALESEMQHKNARGDIVRGYGLPIYKIRMTNRSARRGKRGGFRVIYYLQTSESILFIHIYSKSDQDNVNDREVWGRLTNID